MRLLVILYLSFLSFYMLAHVKHEEIMPKTEIIQEKIEYRDQGQRPKTWTQWIGGFHLILLHFPIALINMVAISELLLLRYKKPIFELSSRFMLITAVILTPFTALLGLIYSYSGSYEGLMKTLLWWHMWFGIFTTIFTIIAVILRERWGIGKLYYCCLTLLVLIVNITGFLGGNMTFGPRHMYLPL